MRTTTSETGHFSDPGLLILSSLMSGPKHGYAMMQDIAEFSGILLEPGTLYGAIARLETRGWIEPMPSEDRKRPYRITAAGMGVLREQLATLQRIVSTGQERLFPA